VALTEAEPVTALAPVIYSAPSQSVRHPDRSVVDNEIRCFTGNEPSSVMAGLVSLLGASGRSPLKR
jgi:hypothetical protein